MCMDGFSRFNFTLQECREGLMRDMAEFGERYTLLQKALCLLDTQEHQELVRQWFDLYMGIYDETSYAALGNRLEELENEIEQAWNFSS